jgi:hypothetical protein
VPLGVALHLNLNLNLNRNPNLDLLRDRANACAVGDNGYLRTMIIIRFPDSETERRALGFLATRFPGKSWANGETLVPEAALGHLAQQGIKFTVEGPASYEQLASLRNPAPAEV